MITNEQLKELLKGCVEVIDEWDLLNGAQGADELTELVKLLAASAHAVGIDPNKLQSFQPMLQNGKFELNLRPRIHDK